MLNILVAYPYLKKATQFQKFIRDAHEQKLPVRIMLDSGAFSAWNVGTAIDLQEYMAFCVDFAPALWGYVALDVVGDQTATMRNLDTMTAAGLRPMPVLTADMTLDMMDPLVAVNPRVCVAGAPMHGGEWAGRRCVAAWEASERKAQLHALGFTRGMLPARVPGIYSVDSSSWIRGQRFLVLDVFERLFGVHSYMLHTLKKKPFSTWPKAAQKVFFDAGVPASVLDEKRGCSGRTSFVNTVTILEWVRFMRWFEAQGRVLFLAAGPASVQSLLIALTCASAPSGRIDTKAWASSTEDNGASILELTQAAVVAASAARGLLAPAFD